jgi:hypothetical protein
VSEEWRACCEDSFSFVGRAVVVDECRRIVVAADLDGWMGVMMVPRTKAE